MLVFSGGDCMMREDLYDLADYAVKKRMRLSLHQVQPIMSQKRKWRWQKKLDCLVGHSVWMVLHLKFMISFEGHMAI